jgi:hypothetical protein
MKTPVVTTILTEVLVTVHLEADMHHPLLNRLSCRSSELKAIWGANNDDTNHEWIELGDQAFPDEELGRQR